MIIMKTFELKTATDSLIMPKITFGAGVFDNIEKNPLYFDMLDIYFKNGGNCLDTARVYCAWLEGGEGLSEKITGQWIEKRHVRDRIIISTKGGHPPLDNMKKSRLDKDSINADIAESLEALRTNYIDIYFLHRDDENKDVSEIIPVLHELVTSGKVRFLGASNWKASRIAEANEYAAKNNLTPFSISQIFFSLAVTTPAGYADETLVCMSDTEYKWYLENSFPVMAFGSQAKGFFTKYLAAGQLNKKIENRFDSEQNKKRASNVAQLCDKLSCSPAALSLAYLTCNSLQTSAIAGFSNVTQLHDSLSEDELYLSMEDVAFLESSCFLP
jgi:aryl-alcohol dehydrogenase-like predicted oxidoreductase